MSDPHGAVALPVVARRIVSTKEGKTSRQHPIFFRMKDVWAHLLAAHHQAQCSNAVVRTDTSVKECGAAAHRHESSPNQFGLQPARTCPHFPVETQCRHAHHAVAATSSGQPCFPFAKYAVSRKCSMFVPARLPTKCPRPEVDC